MEKKLVLTLEKRHLERKEKNSNIVRELSVP
jgi:hypothetical protein